MSTSCASCSCAPDTKPTFRASNIAAGSPRCSRAICSFASAEQWYPVRWTDHVVRVLMSGDRPAQLPEAVMTGIRKREVGGFVRLPSPPQLRKGQTVRVIRGSFEGLLAVHQGMGSRERVWVLLNLMGQQVPVELPSRDVQPLPVAAQ